MTELESALTGAQGSAIAQHVVRRLEALERHSEWRLSRASTAASRNHWRQIMDAVIAAQHVMRLLPPPHAKARGDALPHPARPSLSKDT